MSRSMSRLPRRLPFLIALFMLTPFALWAGFSLAGIGGDGLAAAGSREGLVLLAASLPLAGVFWVQNLRQMGDALGRPSRLALARRLARLLPVAIAAIGGAGLFWLGQGGSGWPVLAVVGLGVGVMAAFAWAAAADRPEPAATATRQPPLSPEEEQRQAERWRWALINLGLLVAFASLAWSPMAILWAAAALTPVVFLLLIGLAAWATRTE